MAKIWKIIKKKQTSLSKNRCENTFQEWMGWQDIRQRKAVKATSLFSVWQQEIALWLVEQSRWGSSISWENSWSVGFSIGFRGKRLTLVKVKEKHAIIFATHESQDKNFNLKLRSHQNMSENYDLSFYFKRDLQKY